MSLLATLKQSTADAHRGLEKSMDVFQRVRSREDYRDLLQRFYAVHAPVEKSLGDAVDWPAVKWNFNDRRKTFWLRADLVTLGVADPGKLSVLQEIPAVRNLGEATGVLYVIEGSTLGGQMISRRFAEMLGIQPENGGRFFHGYGADTGTKWREFGQWAEARAAADGGEFTAEAVRGAQATFETFGRGLG